MRANEEVLQLRQELTQHYAERSVAQVLQNALMRLNQFEAEGRVTGANVHHFRENRTILVIDGLRHSDRVGEGQATAGERFSQLLARDGAMHDAIISTLAETHRYHGFV